MAVDWEIEYPGLRIDDNELAFNVRNTSEDEEAPEGTELGTVTITRKKRSDTDMTPESAFTNPLPTLDRAVPATTSHPITYPLVWDGQEEGDYEVEVTIGSMYAMLKYSVDDRGNVMVGYL